MSYDLFFRSRNTGRTISRPEFTKYFQDRPHYTTDDTQAVYGNEDTGVYFVFEYGELEGEQGAVPVQPITFNLNFFRPHVFALEAEPEVAAFVQHFELSVSDPQNDGMGEGAYSRAGFLAGWNKGNAFAYRALKSEPTDELPQTLPTAQIEAYWKWNLERAGRQAEVGDKAFVPKVFFVNAGQGIRTVTAWGDGIPSLLPKVDLVFVPRTDFAPKGWFRSKPDMVAFEWAELSDLLKAYPTLPGEPGAVELFYKKTPPEIEKAIRDKKPVDEPMAGVAFDQILDKELFDKSAAADEGDGFKIIRTPVE